MILSNKAIREALSNRSIILKPPPEEPFDTTAIDLRLGNSILLPNKKIGAAFDMRKARAAATLKAFYKNKTIDEDGGFTLIPDQFAIANTLEWISLPLNCTPCYAARVEGKSSNARCGLIIHLTAPTIHAGFEGNITLELKNLGHFPITLHRGMFICQLIFEEVKGEIDFNPSQFQGQKKPEGK
jgi:dCTP deaminase